MSFTPGDPRAPAPGPGRGGTLTGDPRSRPGRGTGDLLVTGATGLLGRRVCALLGARHVHHRALVRPRSGHELHGTEGYGWSIDGDLLAPSTLDAPLLGVTRALHLAGLVRSNDAEACRALHVEGTRALLDRGPSLRRVIALSSDTVGRTRPGAYATSKRAMEDLLRARAASGLQVVVLRPPMMLGPGSPHLQSLQRASRWPIVPVPPGAAPRAPVHVDDVAAAVLAALDLPDAAFVSGPLFLDLPGRGGVSFGELVGAVAQAERRRRPPTVEVPGAAVHWGLTALRRVGQGRRAAALDDRLRGMQEEVAADGAPARALLRWAPRSMGTVLADCLAPGGAETPPRR